MKYKRENKYNVLFLTLYYDELKQLKRFFYIINILIEILFMRPKYKHTPRQHRLLKMNANNNLKSIIGGTRVIQNNIIFRLKTDYFEIVA